ncbi:hypothetical protein VNO80_27703 [Phaseolus coccineus]|uniref:Uncharacterized protein n=1 Tax=Phaseolus coccineus TaxID=3886 RepID=A0AAN9LGX4_PHACN
MKICQLKQSSLTCNKRKKVLADARYATNGFRSRRDRVLPFCHFPPGGKERGVNELLVVSCGLSLQPLL